jgi:hypothetical protein
LCVDRRHDMIVPVRGNSNSSTVSGNSNVVRFGKHDVVIEKDWILPPSDVSSFDEKNVEHLVQRFQGGECLETTHYLQKVFKQDPRLAKDFILKNGLTTRIILGHVRKYYGKDKVESFKSAFMKIAAHFPDGQEREMFLKNVVEAKAMESFVAPIVVTEDMGMVPENVSMIQDVFNVQDLYHSDLAIKKSSYIPHADMSIEQTTVNSNYERLTGFKMSELEAAVERLKKQGENLVPSNPSWILFTPESQLSIMKYSLKVAILQPQSIQMFPVTSIQAKSSKNITCAAILFVEPQTGSCYHVLRPISDLFNPFIRSQ